MYVTKNLSAHSGRELLARVATQKTPARLRPIAPRPAQRVSQEMLAKGLRAAFDGARILNELDQLGQRIERNSRRIDLASERELAAAAPEILVALAELGARVDVNRTRLTNVATARRDGTV